MKLIVGLGNPGKEYTWTRHNVGFWFIDKLAKKMELRLNKEKFKGLYGKEKNFILLKPQTYMNNSGKCISDFVNYYKIYQENILIIYDDLFLPLGDFRYRQKGSSAGHNGIKSIIECLKSNFFGRIKIGIGNNNNISWKEWVLQKFSCAEKKEIKTTIYDLVDILSGWIEKKEISIESLIRKITNKKNH